MENPTSESHSGMCCQSGSSPGRAPCPAAGDGHGFVQPWNSELTGASPVQGVSTTSPTDSKAAGAGRAGTGRADRQTDRHPEWTLLPSETWTKNRATIRLSLTEG